VPANWSRIPAILTATGAEIVATSVDGISEHGAKEFSTVAAVGCTTCHGEYAECDLGAGPCIRGATEGSIRAAVDATNEMVILRIAITDAEIKAVFAYLVHLGTMQPDEGNPAAAGQVSPG
jgi:mono/diheme cytochrome c family protein